jgi:multisubunit Na+/H+ antiporter MnhB subunit
MRRKTSVALILIAVGIVVLTYTGILYSGPRSALDAGSARARTENIHSVPLTPIAGAIALAGGLLLLVANGKQVGYSTSPR